MKLKYSFSEWVKILLQMSSDLGRVDLATKKSIFSYAIKNI